MAIKLRPGGLYKTNNGSVVKMDSYVDWNGGFGKVIFVKDSRYDGVWGYRQGGEAAGFGSDHPISIVKEITP